MNALFSLRIISFLICLTLGMGMQAQVGIGTASPDDSAMLHVYSPSKGVLLPRVTTSGRLGIASPATGLIVYDTNLHTFMYFDGASWKALATVGSSVIHPWNVQRSSTRATSNAQNLYVNGTVAIGKKSTGAGAQLDVDGAVRMGSHNTTLIGSNSFAAGENIIASGNASVAFGYNTLAIGDNSAAFGRQTLASGLNSAAFGESTQASGENAAAFGHSTRASGKNSASFGESTIASGENSVAFGQFNVDVADALFMVGIGTSNATRANALTVLNDGWVGVGHTGKSGTEKLRINGSMATSTTSYPDYVFEHYFDAYSSLNPSYRFQSPAEVKDFIIQNGHLPGILPESALAKNDVGHYLINLNELSIRNLEKIEELFLHVIAQEDAADEISVQIAEMKLKNRKLEEERTRLQEVLLELNERLRVVEAR